jgi:hypothetical protein
VPSRYDTAYGSRQSKSGLPDFGHYLTRHSRASPTLLARSRGLGRDDGAAGLQPHLAALDSIKQRGVQRNETLTLAVV